MSVIRTPQAGRRVAMPTAFHLATTVFGLDWYIAVLVILVAVALLLLGLSATGLWKAGSMGRRGAPRNR